MRVSGVGSGWDMQTKGTGMSPGMGEPMDEVSKGIQKQIENLQKQMKELSANQEMTPDMKMKKRQELQKQISELQIQLRQHQMEVKREEARKREEKASQDDVLNPTKSMEREQGTGISAGSMEAMISADASMKQAGVHGSTAKHAQNRAGILKAEIKRDKGGPGDATAAKEEALAETETLAKKASASQMEALGKANEVMKEASEAEKQKTDDKKNEKTEETGRKEETDHTTSDTTVSGEEKETGQDGSLWASAYHPVDVRI